MTRSAHVWLPLLALGAGLLGSCGDAARAPERAGPGEQTSSTADVRSAAPILGAEGAAEPVFGRIEIEVPQGPPSSDPVEGGTWVLSIHVELEGGRTIDHRRACSLEVDGEDVTIRFDRPADPIAARVAEGRFRGTAREGDASFELRGQVVGPGKLRGTVAAAEEEDESLRVLDGRWALDRIK